MLQIRTLGVESALAGLAKYDPSTMRSRLRVAIRLTLSDGKAALESGVKARYTAKAPMRLGSTRSNVSALKGSLKVGGRRNPLRQFIISPRQRINPGPPGGVFANVVRGQGGNIRRGFLQRSGGVYERVGRPRLPIRQLKTISLPGMAKAVSDKVISRMRIRLGMELGRVFS